MEEKNPTINKSSIPVNKNSSMNQKTTQKLNQNDQVQNIQSNYKNVGQALHMINCSPIKFENSDDFSNLYADFLPEEDIKKCKVIVNEEEKSPELRLIDQQNLVHLHPITEETSFEYENLQQKEKFDLIRHSTQSLKKKLQNSHDNNSSSENMNIYNKNNLTTTGNNTSNIITSPPEQIIITKASKKWKSNKTTSERQNEKNKALNKNSNKKEIPEQKTKNMKVLSKNKSQPNKIVKKNVSENELTKNDVKFSENPREAYGGYMYSDPSDLSNTKSKSAQNTVPNSNMISFNNSPANHQASEYMKINFFGNIQLKKDPKSSKEINCDKEKNSDFSADRRSLDEQKNNTQINLNPDINTQSFSEHLKGRINSNRLKGVFDEPSNHLIQEDTREFQSRSKSLNSQLKELNSYEDLDLNKMNSKASDSSTYKKHYTNFSNNKKLQIQTEVLEPSCGAFEHKFDKEMTFLNSDNNSKQNLLGDNQSGNNTKVSGSVVMPEKIEVSSNKIANGNESEQNHNNLKRCDIDDPKKKSSLPSTKNSNSQMAIHNFGSIKDKNQPIPAHVNQKPKHIYGLISNPVIKEESNIFETSKDQTNTIRTHNSINSARRSLSETRRTIGDDHAKVEKNFESFGKKKSINVKDLEIDESIYSSVNPSRNFFN